MARPVPSLAGWRTIVAGALGIASGYTLLVYVQSIFVVELTEEFGWTRGQMTLTGVSVLLAGVCAIVVARASDRLGVRPILVTATLGYAGFLVALSQQPGTLATYFTLYFFVVLFGLGTTSVIWTRPVSAAFDASRGLALSLTMTGSSLSTAAAPFVIEWVIDTHGWRSAYIALAGFALIAGAFAWLMLPRSATLPLPKIAAGPAADGAVSAMRSPRFLLLAAGFVLINVPGGGLLSQLAPLLSDRGLGAGSIAPILSGFAISVVLGRLLAGLLLDRVSPPHVAAVSMLSPAIGCLILSITTQSVPLAFIGVVLFGLSQGAEGDIGPFMIARYFGLANYSQLASLLALSNFIGTATGMVLFGQIFDATRSYQTALGIGAVAFLAGALCFFAIGHAAPKAAHLGEESKGRPVLR